MFIGIRNQALGWWQLASVFHQKWHILIPRLEINFPKKKKRIRLPINHLKAPFLLFWSNFCFNYCKHLGIAYMVDNLIWNYSISGSPESLCCVLISGSQDCWSFSIPRSRGNVVPWSYWGIQTVLWSQLKNLYVSVQIM